MIMVYLGKTVERKFYYGAGREILEKARFLRNNMTHSERIIWQEIRKRKFFGIIFRRQHPIGLFIVDFYCHEVRLVIEIDGNIHDLEENMEYDENRTFELKKLGLQVIRFRNEEIECRINKVLEILAKEIKNRKLRTSK
jgi:very-short-patch-repair endonuclease